MSDYVTDLDINEALSIYLEDNEASEFSALRTEAILRHYRKYYGNMILIKIREIITVLIALRPDFKKLGVTGILSLRLSGYIKNEMHLKYPDLNKESLSLLAFAYAGWWRTFSDSHISNFASIYELPIITGKLPLEINDAIVLYFGWGQHNGIDDRLEAVIKKYGNEKGRELNDVIDKLTNELYMLDPDWKRYDTTWDPEIWKFVEDEMHKKHPELNTEALKVLSNDFVFNMK